jgi:hypothetical protein
VFDKSICSIFLHDENTLFSILYNDIGNLTSYKFMQSAHKYDSNELILVLEKSRSCNFSHR